jgi:hypothetical protein
MLRLRRGLIHKGGLDRLKQGRLVSLHRQQIIPFLFNDLGGDSVASQKMVELSRAGFC